MLLHASDDNGGAARVVIGNLKLLMYRRGPPPRDRPVPFDVLATSSIPKESDVYPFGILQASRLGSVLYFADRKLVSLWPTKSSLCPDPCSSSLRHPIASSPPGITSTGDPLLVDTDSDKEGILHVYTVVQCERQKSEANPNMQEWSRPRCRHWLCRTVVGDTRASAVVEEAKEDKGFASDEVVRGGASSDIVCELFDESLDELAPYRIIRCKGAKLCAVLFRPALSNKLGSSKGFTLNAVSIAFVDYSVVSPAIRVVDGRDVAFWPVEGSADPRGVILSQDGSALTSFTWDPSKRTCRLGAAFRPIVGVDTDMNYVECRRIYCFAGGAMLGLAVVGTRLRDGASCFLVGELCPAASMTLDGWSGLIPNIVSGRSVWFREGEEVFSVAGLEGDDSGYRNFALATSSRVLIISSSVEIAAEVPAVVSSCALAPLGAFSVAYCVQGKVRYLCCLDGALASNAIASLPIPKGGISCTLLTAVRPDRFILTDVHGGTRLVEYSQNPHTFLLPTAVTKPALLLEPMVANAISVGGKQSVSSPVLRTVIEKFGRKVASLTHGDDEGIGNIGAGITPRTFEMLEKYELRQASSWLLTGTVPFDRGATSKILPPWLPVAPKAKAALNSNGFLHVISSGDQYFSDYVKTPDAGVASSLPRQTGPSAYICRESAMKALIGGNGIDAVKELDLVGGESTDSMILRLALALEKDHSRDATGLLKSLSGYDESSFARSSNPVKAPASLAALALTLKLNKQRGNLEMSGEEIARWMKPLAPSLQRGARAVRTRQTIFGKAQLDSIGEKIDNQADPSWISACKEAKHVW